LFINDPVLKGINFGDYTETPKLRALLSKTVE
jgi:hypothetical protein